MSGFQKLLFAHQSAGAGAGVVVPGCVSGNANVGNTADRAHGPSASWGQALAPTAPETRGSQSPRICLRLGLTVVWILGGWGLPKESAFPETTEMRRNELFPLCSHQRH